MHVTSDPHEENYGWISSYPSCGSGPQARLVRQLEAFKYAIVKKK